MTDATQTQILLSHWHETGNPARDRLLRRLYPELESIAASRLRGEYDCSLSTGDLINEAVLKLLRLEGEAMHDRAHFLALSSRMMRNILIDHIRAKHSEKRRHMKVELCTRVEGEQRFDLNSLESALIRLGAIDPELMELVEMRYFGGMTVTDISEVTGWSDSTIKRRWQSARAWLTDALANPIDHG